MAVMVVSPAKWTIVFVILAAPVMAGCGSSVARGPGAGPSAKAQTSSGGAPPVTPSPSGSVGSAAAGPVCQTAQLKITMTKSAAAGGTSGGYLGFRNRGHAACHLGGWPLLTAITAAGKTAAAVHKHTTMFGPTKPAVSIVTLRPGAVAYAVFTGGDNPPGFAAKCPPSYKRLRVIPPGNSSGVVISAWLPDLDAYLPACTSIFVSEVVPPSAVYLGSS